MPPVCSMRTTATSAAGEALGSGVALGDGEATGEGDPVGDPLGGALGDAAGEVHAPKIARASTIRAGARIIIRVLDAQNCSRFPPVRNGQARPAAAGANLPHGVGSLSIVNRGALDYRIATTKDVSLEMESQVIEYENGPGPYGSKKTGESGLLSTAPAIASAINEATGVVIRDLPLTPERVWRALRDAAGKQP